MSALDDAAGVYVHLPFCPYVCPYCDFAKWPMRRSDARRYLAALHAEIARTPSRAASTLFLGGGTPNTYSADDLAGLLAALRERFAPGGFAETTIELNPDRALCTPDAFEAYAKARIDRYSFGVQSFEPQELATLGRPHTRDDVERAIALARPAAARGVSLDLIFGIPGQTVDSWARTLDRAIALEPDHVSTYGLTVEPGTPFERWLEREPSAFPDDDAQADCFALAIDRLERAGYDHYEISNFARPGFRCAHNANYWRNGDYVGLGVGAASYRAGVRRANTRDLGAYLAAIEAGRPVPGDDERLEGARRAGEAAMLALRTAEGVELARFAERYHVDFMEFYAPVVADARESGTLDVTPTHVRLTRRGRFLANDVCAAFVTYAVD